MGWTNSVPILHGDVCYILQPEIPHVTQLYIDDVPVRGPATRYIQENGKPETIPGNSGIRRFIWEHFQDLNQVVQRMKYSGGRFSGYKSTLCTPEIMVLRHCCTFDGRLPDQTQLRKIINWRPCKDLLNMWAFLGTMGVCRLFIKNFAHRAHHLVKLTQKGAEWEFGMEQLEVMDNLKQALLTSPALRPIDYTVDAPVILAVDTLHIAIRYILSQCSMENPKLWYHSRFGSITLNECECRFSQPKLELCRLYCTLRILKLYLIGVRNLIIKVNMKYIKGMLKNPDIAPSASINRWIILILMFHFTLVHVPGLHHGPDGLSMRKLQPGDKEEPEDNFNDWINNINGFMHLVNLHPSNSRTTTLTPIIATYALDTVHEDSPEPDSPHLENDNTVTPYLVIPQSDLARTTDEKLGKVQHWLETLEQPDSMTDTEYRTFMWYCTEFFVAKNRLWWKDPAGQHKIVIDQEQRIFLLAVAHNDVGHHRIYTTNALLAE